MWYVEKLFRTTRTRDGEDVVRDEPCIYCIPSVRKVCSISLVLRNTETDDVVRLRGEHGAWLKLEKTLMQYKPYGFESMQIGIYMLIKVDERALKFLDFVESVDFYRHCEDKAVRGLVWSFQQEFWFLDNLGSFVACDDRYADSKYAFTLFDVLVYLKRGWLGDKFYMRCTNSSTCCVSFSDVGKARAMLAKAAVTGYNPLESFRHNRVGIILGQQ